MKKTLLFSLVALGSLLGASSPAAAATSHDLKGSWSCCGPGGAGAQVFVIKAMDLGSGKFTGSATYPTGATFSPITGTATGDSVSLTTGPYVGSSYSATFTGAIAADNKTMSGSWTSNVGQSGTWTATRSSGGGSTPPGGYTFDDLRITCAGTCHVVTVRMTFNAAGQLLGEQVLEETQRAQASKKKALVKKVSTSVKAGANNIKVKLTSAGKKKLRKKGKLSVKVRFTYTPTGGTASTQTKTIKVKRKRKRG